MKKTNRKKGEVRFLVPRASPTSDVWKHMNKNDPELGKATCRMCDKVLRYNGATTSNLWDHVHRMHSSLFPVKREGPNSESTQGAGSSPRSTLARAAAAPKLQRSSSRGCPSMMAAFLSKQVCPEPRARKINELLALW